MNGDNSNNNNQNNNFNIYSSMDENAFSIFDQAAAKPENNPNTGNIQPGTVQQGPVMPTEPPTDNMVTVNDYKPPKEPFSLKNLLKKKVEEEEKKIDLNDLSSFVVEKKSEDDIEEEKEKKKKQKELILLIVLLVILAVMGYFAYTVFSNYLETKKDYVIPGSIKTTIKKEVKQEPKKKIVDEIYECTKELDIETYKLPLAEYINTFSYKGNNKYTFKNNSLYKIEESFELIYDNTDEEQKKIITKYCNSYNSIFDSYQLLCKYTNDILAITNSFYIKKLDSSTINNGDITFNLIYNSETNSEKLLEDNQTCKKQG